MTNPGEQERRSWWRTARDAWLSPAGVVVLLSGITWGVWLNGQVLDAAARDGRQDTRIETLEQLLQQHALTQARTVTLLDEIARRLERHESRIEANEHRRLVPQGAH